MHHTIAVRLAREMSRPDLELLLSSQIIVALRLTSCLEGSKTSVTRRERQTNETHRITRKT